MIAKSICAALTAAFLAVVLLAFGAPHARAAETKTAIFAGGCFWCVEDAFDEIDGVTETISGYAGGTKPNPNYGDHEGYTEAVKVTYDPAKVTYAKLLDHFWRNIDPFDPNGQFCDQGPAYQSVVFVGDDEEKALAEKTKAEIAERTKNLHIIGTFEGSRFFDGFLTHASLHLLDGFVLVFLHPPFQCA